jgi:PAS domain S-box-containing protein
VLTQQSGTTLTDAVRQGCMQLVFQSSWDAFAVMDHHGTLLEVNESFLRLVGYERDELLGTRVQDLELWEDLGHHPELSDALAGRDSAEAEILFRSRAGTLRSAQISLRNFEMESRRWIVFLGRDISEQKEAEAALHVSLESLISINDHRKRLLSHLVSAHEEERRQVSGEIDEDTMQAISSVAMNLSYLRRSLVDPDQVRQIARTEARVKTALSRLRNLAFDLRPPALETSGLADAIHEYLSLRVAEAGIEWSLENRASRRPPVETQLVLYRIAQEALSNVLKHAEATRVEVVVDERDGGFTLTVADDGIGCVAGSDENEPIRLGIACMNERAELAGGWCRLESTPGRGTIVECWVPSADWSLFPDDHGQDGPEGEGGADGLGSIWSRAEEMVS